MDSFQKLKYNFDINQIANEVTHFMQSYDTTQICLSTAEGSNDPQEAEGNAFYNRVDGKWVKKDKVRMDDEYDTSLDMSKYPLLDSVIGKLSENYNLYRIRLMILLPNHCYTWHKDFFPRLHLPILTNPDCFMVVEDSIIHMPADGDIWLVDTVKYHTAYNVSNEKRIHLIASYSTK